MISSIYRQQPLWAFWAFELLWKKQNYREISVRFPWAGPQKYQQRPQKYQQRPQKYVKFCVRKPWTKSGVRRLKKSGSNNIADIRACALHVYIHVLVDRLNIWSTSVGWRDLGRCCMIFLYIIGLSFRPKLHIKSWTMITKCTFLYDKCPSIHDIANKYHVFEKLLGSFRNDPQTWGLSAKDPKNWGGWNTSFFFKYICVYIIYM